MSAEPDDLLSKADALMARHHPGRTPAPQHPEIPVLEEVVDAPSEIDDLPLLNEYVVLPPPDKEQIEALVAQVRASLLAEMQGSIDGLIDERLKESLAPLIERMFSDLRADLQQIARETLVEAIHRTMERDPERRR